MYHMDTSSDVPIQKQIEDIENGLDVATDIESYF